MKVYRSETDQIDQVLTPSADAGNNIDEGNSDEGEDVTQDGQAEANPNAGEVNPSTSDDVYHNRFARGFFLCINASLKKQLNQEVKYEFCRIFLNICK